MRSLLTILLVTVLAVPASAGGRRRTAVVSAARPEVAIVFTGLSGSGSDGLFDAGVMSQAHNMRHKHGATTTKTFGIRLDAPNASGRTATLRASLESFDGRCSVRVDGIELGTAPKVIAARALLGGLTAHTLEIVVPPTVPEGTFASSIRWEATTN